MQLLVFLYLSFVFICRCVCRNCWIGNLLIKKEIFSPVQKLCKVFPRAGLTIRWTNEWTSINGEKEANKGYNESNIDPNFFGPTSIKKCLNPALGFVTWCLSHFDYTIICDESIVMWHFIQLVFVTKHSSWHKWNFGPLTSYQVVKFFFPNKNTL